jgi:Family of unknown function (DUF5681)
MTDLKPHTSGYMKPPKHSQFKPGKSGNPNGRPKQSPTPYTALQNALKRKVTVKGEARKIRLDEALIRRLRELALGGDRRAITMQQKILEVVGISPHAEEPVPDLLAAKERFREMMRKSHEPASSEGDNDD